MTREGPRHENTPLQVGTDGERAALPAVAVPERTDFVGCGNHAAARAVQQETTALTPN